MKTFFLNWMLLSKRSTRILCGALVLVPLVSHAKIIDLVCSDSVDRSSMAITVDLSQHTVLMDGHHMQNVTITKNEINFVRDLGVAGKWSQKINRTTGVLLVQIPGSNDFLDPWKCENANPKF